MMQAKEVEALITALVEPILADTEMTLVDVEYVREKGYHFDMMYNPEIRPACC